MVSPYYFIFIKILFLISIISINSNIILWGMNFLSHLFRLDNNFHLKIDSNPDRPDLARGRAGLAQNNSQNLKDKINMKSKKSMNYFPQVSYYFMLYSELYFEFFLNLIFSVYGGIIIFAQLMEFKTNIKVNSNSSLYARRALKIALQIELKICQKLVILMMHVL